jgi:hypothetical protein
MKPLQIRACSYLECIHSGCPSVRGYYKSYPFSRRGSLIETNVPPFLERFKDVYNDALTIAQQRPHFLCNLITRPNHPRCTILIKSSNPVTISVNQAYLIGIGEAETRIASPCLQ